LTGPTFTPQITRRAVLAYLPDANRLDAVASGVDATHKDAFQRQVRGQETGNGLGGLRDFNMSAGFPPNIH
jgi:hypothetical protein